MGVRLPVSVEPLLPECRQESREQCGTKGHIKRSLGLTDGGIWPSPAWRRDWLAGRDNSNGDVEEKLQEGVIHFFVVRLEFRLDRYYECGSYSRKQTRLPNASATLAL